MIEIFTNIQFILFIRWFFPIINLFFKHNFLLNSTQICLYLGYIWKF